MNHGDSPIAPYPVQAWFMGSLTKLAFGQGREDFGSLSAGQSLALIRHDNARELMDELVRETPKVLCRVCLRE
jgi:nitronate monooxygenase